MLYEFYNIDVSYNEIWKEISLSDTTNPMNRHCFNYLMIKHLLKNGYQAVAVSVNDLSLTLSACKENGIDVILNHRRKKNHSQGHYSVYLGSDYKNIHVNDPEKASGDSVVKFVELRRLMSDFPKSDEIVRANTLILINFIKPMLPTKEIVCEDKTIELFDCLVEYSTELVCYHHNPKGHWISNPHFL